MKRGKEYRIPHVKEVESLAPIPYVFFGAEKKVLKKKFCGDTFAGWSLI